MRSVVVLIRDDGHVRSRSNGIDDFTGPAVLMRSEVFVGQAGRLTFTPPASGAPTSRGSADGAGRGGLTSASSASGAAGRGDERLSIAGFEIVRYGEIGWASPWHPAEHLLLDSRALRGLLVGGARALTGTTSMPTTRSAGRLKDGVATGRLA